MSGLKFRRGDFVVLLLAAVVSVVCCLQIWRPRPAGQAAVIVSPEGEQRYLLSQQTTFTVEGNDGNVLSIEIDGGRVRVAHSDCPDQVCVHSGWLSKNGQTAACVPAGVSVRVVGGAAEVDGVTA